MISIVKIVNNSESIFALEISKKKLVGEFLFFEKHIAEPCFIVIICATSITLLVCILSTIIL